VIRFVVILLVTYLVFKIIRSIVQAFAGASERPHQASRPGTEGKPKAEYRDVQEAEFEDLSDKGSSPERDKDG
jgi:hypothetical protein